MRSEKVCGKCIFFHELDYGFCDGYCSEWCEEHMSDDPACESFIPKEEREE